MKRKKRKKKKVEKFPSKIGKITPFKRTVFRKPYTSPKYDDREVEITETFRVGDVDAVCELLGLSKTHVYRILSRFDLIRGRNEEINAESAVVLAKQQAEYMKETWGWDGGSDRLVLFKFQVVKKGGIFKSKKRNLIAKNDFRRYILPVGVVLKYLIAHGLKYWVLDGKEILIDSIDKGYICVDA
jgi:hypothetical protein